MSNSPSSAMSVNLAVSAGHAVCLSLAGDIDLASEPDLDSVAVNLAATRCTAVYIDLGGVTFAGSSLIKFLFRLAGDLPGYTALTVCRPNPMILQLFELTGIPEVVVVHAGLPPDWAPPWAATGIDTPIHAVAMA